MMPLKAPKNFNPTPFTYHQILELTIEKLTNLGCGLARIDGWVIMVNNTLPGEHVRVKVFRNYKNYSQADLLEILTPSKDRIQAPCPYFSECGGCQYQNLAYPAQLDWKRRHLEETFQKLAQLDCEALPTIGSPKEFAYRSKITPHFHKPSADPQAPFPIGFLKNGTRSHIVDIPNCIIAKEPIQEALSNTRAQLLARKGTLKRGGTLFFRTDKEDKVATDPNALIQEQVGDFCFQFRAGDFFQNNPYILPHFVQYVVQEAKGDGQTPYLVDAYSGAGLFAISAHRDFKQVIGVEVSESSVQYAKANARLNGANNTEFILSPAEAMFQYIPFRGAETTVILDPPRKGCDEDFLRQLVAFGPKKIVYISCEPSTQARDAVILAQAGYQLHKLQPFDLFPQTRHIESVACFAK